MRIPSMAAVAASLFLAACTTPSQPSASASLWPAAPRDFASADEAIAVAAQFPNSAGMQRRRLGAAMQAGDAPAVLDTMRRLAAMGAILSAAGQAQVTQLVGAEAMAPISAQMTANAAPVAASSNPRTIPAEHRLIEGLIWDNDARQLYATSVVGRALVLVGDGSNTVVAGDGLGSLLGGAYDPVRKRIWIASAQVEPTPRDRPNFVGLVSIDPSRPADIARIPAPEGATPGDVAVARDGNVYVSDGMNGALYRCAPSCTSLETLLSGRLFSAQGLALSADQRLLYIADRRYGLAALERGTGRLLRVTAPAGVMLDGIDGLVAHGGALYATQTAFPPARIVRLRLSPDGLAVTALDVLERANPEWGEVTLMTVADGHLLYVAGAQWDNHGAGGVPNPQAPPGPTPIRALPLR